MKFFILLGALLFYICAFVSASEKKDASSSLAVHADATSSVDMDEGKKDSSSGKIGSKIFIPSSDWKVVEEDDIIFNGLHYRINMATGLKEAKLMEGSDGSKYLAAAKRWLQARHKKQAGTSLEAKEEKLLLQEFEGSFASDVAADHDSFLADVMKIDDSLSSGDALNPGSGDFQEPKDKESSGRKFRSYEELKQELADLNLIMESEQNVVAKKILVHLNLTTVSEELESLADFEYLLHNSDNALAFIDNGGYERVLLPSLTSSSWEVRLLGCRLVSASVQNFAKAQIAAHEAGLLARLISLLMEDQKTSVQSAALSSLGSLVRHFPLAQQKLVALGLEAIRTTLLERSDAPAALRWKMMKLLSDLLTERHGEQGEVSPERLDQLAAANLEAALTGLGWCQFLVEEFKKLDESFAAPLPMERKQRSALDALLQAAESSSKLCEDDLRGSLPHLRLLQDKLRTERPRLEHQSFDHDADESSDGAYDEELAIRIQGLVEVYEKNIKEEL